MAQVAKYQGLSDLQRKFVASYVRNADPELAAIEAGYSDSGPNPGYQVLHSPLIVAAIQSALRHAAQTEGASIGYATLKRIAQDKQAPAGAQADAAKALLDRGGMPAVKAVADKGQGDKPLAEMTIEELQQQIRQRSEQAKDVTQRADNARLSPAVIDQEPDIFE